MKRILTVNMKRCWDYSRRRVTKISSRKILSIHKNLIVVGKKRSLLFQ